MADFDFIKLSNLLFPNVNETIDDLEKKYPSRDVPAGAVITRIGPSPTGFVHLGNLYNAIIGERLAHQSRGVFFLRIEDTDNKREVAGAVDTIINAMSYFDVFFDEGAVSNGDSGCYGPYRQRQRKKIYHVIAKWLVSVGLAYPCFCSEKDLEEIRKEQISVKRNTGYYGEYAKCRQRSFEDIKKNIELGKPWVLRYKSQNLNDYVYIEDAIRGRLSLPKNNMDFVLLKSDGIPTYHFAHVVDDHFMRTTHVIRGEEWIPSLPMHVELFDAMKWKKPIYCHTATLMKQDGNSKRKLSKRKDPELALSFYQSEGVSKEAVWEFLLGILNSNFEEWRINNPTDNYNLFQFSLSKMSNSGALFDLDKLKDISKNVISCMTANEVYDRWLSWCESYNFNFANLIKKYKERTIAALQIGRNITNRRKDIETWKQACEFMSFYYDETFQIVDDMSHICEEDIRTTFFNKYLDVYNFNDDSKVWFDKIKKITEELGFAVRPKDYKNNPQKFHGSIIDITNMLRIALTGRANAPDIWEICRVLGEDITLKRLIKWRT